MQSRWNDAEAAEFVARYGAGHGEDLALRVYTSRLIGQDATLVLHGGGNTSVKTRACDALGDELEVLCVKGSGWDLGGIEPAGLPAVDLAWLRRLRGLAAMTDDEMVAGVRRGLLDPGAPNPSVEALLHAFLPQRFVDHTHADAIVTLTNQPDGAAVVRDALGDEVVVLPWIMPGFPLAKAVADAWERAPDCAGVVLLQHGIFTFGDSARASYERMIELVDRAERYIEARGGGEAAMTAGAPAPAADAAEIGPVIRGALARGEGRGRVRMVCRHLDAPDLLAFSAHSDCARLCATGPLTPDHVIRTKGRYLYLTRDEARDPAACRARVADYAADYTAYFEHNRGRVAPAPAMLDPHPRVVVVAGAGVFAFGLDDKAAGVAADIAAHTLRAKARAEAIGAFTELPQPDLFEMEYWPLEQRKLGARRPPPLEGRVALVTGAGGAIGHGIAAELLAHGAHVCLTDVDEARLARAAELLRAELPGAALCTQSADVTDAAAVDAVFAACCRRFGGVDVVVPNAGVAHVSTLRDMDVAAFRRVVDVNLTGTLTVLRAAARVFERQQTGGAVVVQASKNVFDPGAGFGAYSASKAGAAQLAKIAALELAGLGVRVNAINADAVFGGDVESGLWAAVGPERMKARGLDPDGLRAFYRARSLLKVEVTPRDVGRAVVFFAAETTPTTGATLPVDGGVPGAFPR